MVVSTSTGLASTARGRASMPATVSCRRVSWKEETDMAFDFVLRNARIADGTALKSVDIAIANGRIDEHRPRLDGEGESVDARDRFVSPGLVERGDRYGVRLRSAQRAHR